MSRHHDKRDVVESGLVRIAEQMGAGWYRAPPLDGWLAWRGTQVAVEIKDPEREGLAHEYTPQQQRYFSWCRLHNVKWLVWRTMADVLRDLNS